TFLGSIAFGASPGSPAPATAPASTSTFGRLPQPGGALDRADIDCYATLRMSPRSYSVKEIEKRARRTEEDLRHRGKTPTEARIMADAMRRSYAALSGGLVHHGRVVYHYDARSWSANLDLHREFGREMDLSRAIFFRRPR